MDGFTVDQRRPGGPDRQPHDGLLHAARPPLLLQALPDVRDERPLLLLGARADLPEPLLPAGRHLVRPHPATTSRPSPTEYSQPTIFDLLDAAGITWKIYQSRRCRSRSSSPTSAPAPRPTSRRSRSTSPTPPPARCRRCRSSIRSSSARDRRTTSIRRPTCSSARRSSPSVVNALMTSPHVAELGALPHLRRARRLLRPRAAAAGLRARRRSRRRCSASDARRPSTATASACRSSSSRRSRASATSRTRVHRSHVDPALHRDALRPAGAHRARRERRPAARAVRLRAIRRS